MCPEGGAGEGSAPTVRRLSDLESGANLEAMHRRPVVGGISVIYCPSLVSSISSARAGCSRSRRRLLREQPALSDDTDDTEEGKEMTEMDGVADADLAKDLAESDETETDEPDEAADSQQPSAAAEMAE